VYVNVGSQIRLHGVETFDEAASVAHGTGARYGQALPIPMLVKASDCLNSTASLLASLPVARITIIGTLMAFNEHICVQR
jgi:hypothetical protein